jgi:hypothetical protein
LYWSVPFSGLPWGMPPGGGNVFDFVPPFDGGVALTVSGLAALPDALVPDAVTGGVTAAPDGVAASPDGCAVTPDGAAAAPLPVGAGAVDGVGVGATVVVAFVSGALFFSSHPASAATSASAAIVAIIGRIIARQYCIPPNPSIDDVAHSHDRCEIAHVPRNFLSHSSITV